MATTKIAGWVLDVVGKGIDPHIFESEQAAATYAKKMFGYLEVPMKVFYREDANIYISVMLAGSR